MGKIQRIEEREREKKKKKTKENKTGIRNNGHKQSNAQRITKHQQNTVQIESDVECNFNQFIFGLPDFPPSSSSVSPHFRLCSMV